MTGRRLEVLAGSLALVAVVWNASTGCAIAPSGPVTGCTNFSTVLTCISAVVTITADAPVEYSIRDTAHTSPGSSNQVIVGLTPGPFDIVGRTSASSLSMEFAGLEATVPGGIIGTSIESLSGPGAVVSSADCRVTYTAGATTTRPYEFHIRFATDTTAEHC